MKEAFFIFIIIIFLKHLTQCNIWTTNGIALWWDQTKPKICGHAQKWLKEKQKICVLQWPFYSLDLNSTGNLWSELKSDVQI